MHANADLKPLCDVTDPAELLACIQKPYPAWSRHYITFSHCDGQGASHVFATPLLAELICRHLPVQHPDLVYLSLKRKRKQKGKYRLYATHFKGTRVCIAKLDEDLTSAWLAAFVEPVMTQLPERRWLKTRMTYGGERHDAA